MASYWGPAYVSDDEEEEETVKVVVVEKPTVIHQKRDAYKCRKLKVSLLAAVDTSTVQPSHRIKVGGLSEAIMHDIKQTTRYTEIPDRILLQNVNLVSYSNEIHSDVAVSVTSQFKNVPVPHYYGPRINRLGYHGSVLMADSRVVAEHDKVALYESSSDLPVHSFDLMGCHYNSWAKRIFMGFGRYWKLFVGHPFYDYIKVVKSDTTKTWHQENDYILVDSEFAKRKWDEWIVTLEPNFEPWSGVEIGLRVLAPPKTSAASPAIKASSKKPQEEDVTNIKYVRLVLEVRYAFLDSQNPSNINPSLDATNGSASTVHSYGSSMGTYSVPERHRSSEVPTKQYNGSW